MSIYPYYSYYDDSTTYPLDFALGKPTSTVTVKDGAYAYTSLFDAMYDAARVALDRCVAQERLCVHICQLYDF